MQILWAQPVDPNRKIHNKTHYAFFPPAGAMFPQSCHKFTKSIKNPWWQKNLVDASDSQLSATTVFCAPLFPDPIDLDSSGYGSGTLWVKQIWSTLLLQKELPVLPTLPPFPLLWSQSLHLPLILLCTTSSTCLILHWVDLFLRNKAWAEELT